MYTVYSKPSCTWCDQAKALLTSKGLPFQEMILDQGQPKLPGKSYCSVAELQSRVPGVRTVPQIFHGDQHIGGFEQLNKSLM